MTTIQCTYAVFSPSFLVIPPPIELKPDVISSTSVTISWQLPDDLNHYVSEYQVGYTMKGGKELFHKVQDRTSTELTSLEPDTEYTIRVRAKVENFGDYSTPITIHTKGNCGDRIVLIYIVLHKLMILHAVSGI